MTRRTPHLTGGALLPILAAALLATWALPAAASAAIFPIVSGTTVTAASETTASFRAAVNPNNRSVENAHFQYITRAQWQADGESFGEGTQSTAAQALPSGESPVTIEAQATALLPGTAYRLRVYAEGKAGTTEGEAEAASVPFATLAPPPTFGPCPNDLFRTGGPGVALPLGDPSAALPDCRAYERASPLDKNGSDLAGTTYISKASRDGDRVSFLGASPFPGSESGLNLKPTFVASRGPGGWSTRGVEPPASGGEVGKVEGFTPDLSHFYTWASLLGEPILSTLFDRSAADGALTAIAGPATGLAELIIPGAAADGSVVYFEYSGAALAPGARSGAPNLYAWDRATGAVRLAGALNDESAPAGGAVVGEPANLKLFTPTHDRRTISADGRSAYFSTLGGGQLYRRLNANKPQSPLNGAGECEDPALACTIHVSATEKTNGQGTDGADPAGPQPTKFAAASEDGDTALFISPEKLTNDANTGPEQPLAAIGRLVPGESGPEEVEEGFLPAHAVGLAVDPAGEHVYWADPKEHSIGRATIDPAACAPAAAPCEVQPGFVEPGETECEGKKGVANQYEHAVGPSEPRYVAADSEHLYWTNTGPRAADGRAWVGCGTIGRAAFDGSGNLLPGSVEAEFIPGERETGPGEFEMLIGNPQGIAVDAGHLYWANGIDSTLVVYTGLFSRIARATLAGGQVEPNFAKPSTQGVPDGGVAVDGSHIYVAVNDYSNNIAQLNMAPLAGGEYEPGVALGAGAAGARGVALVGGYLYWADEGTGAIARYPLADLGTSGFCATIPSCEPEYLKPAGNPLGLAADPAREHLYFSLNGEAPTNPGTDLYRYTATANPQGHHLADLTPDPAAEDGAEVRGVIGASADASRVYFLANAVLTEAPNAAGETAAPGSCAGQSVESETGQCNLYLSDEGRVSFIARLQAGVAGGDNFDWRTTYPSSSDHLPEARVSPDGRTLLFSSTQKLTPYDNHGTRELYRYRAGQGIACVSCNPSGTAPLSAPRLGSIDAVVGGQGLGINRSSPVLSRNLSASGGRVFFETAEALVGPDTDGTQDVYEWEVPGTPGGSCSEASSSYSPQDEGCLYLLSSGAGAERAFFLDADEEGDNVFFFTRARLVGADADQLIDVYDARALGGLAAQNPLPPKVCEGEACKGPASATHGSQSPATPSVGGSGNVKEKARRCPKGKRQVKKRGHTRCLKKHRKRHRHGKAHR